MARLEPELVVIYPMMSEDTVKLIEGENKVTFIVNNKATKHDVKCFFFQAEDGIRDHCVTGVQTCALPISVSSGRAGSRVNQITRSATPFSCAPLLPPARP